jgi:hypothetical protein
MAPSLVADSGTNMVPMVQPVSRIAEESRESEASTQMRVRKRESLGGGFGLEARACCVEVKFS